jgi:hypothetical protein
MSGFRFLRFERLLQYIYVYLFVYREFLRIRHTNEEPAKSNRNVALRAFCPNSLKLLSVNSCPKITLVLVGFYQNFTNHASNAKFSISHRFLLWKICRTPVFFWGKCTRSFPRCCVVNRGKVTSWRLLSLGSQRRLLSSSESHRNWVLSTKVNHLRVLFVRFSSIFCLSFQWDISNKGLQYILFSSWNLPIDRFLNRQ